MKPNQLAYLESLSEELASQAKRVRHLIGDAHWLTDGHHKESVLAEIIKRHVPSSLIVARGFVVNPYEEDVCSNEQDILIVDTAQEAPLFYQHNVVVTTPKHLYASISVKSSFSLDQLRDSINGQASIMNTFSQFDPIEQIFFGTFFFEEDGLSDVRRKNVLKEFRVLANNINFHENKGELWEPFTPCVVSLLSGELLKVLGIESDKCKCYGFDCNKLGFSVFIILLIEHIASRRSQSRSTVMNFVQSLDLPTF